MIAARLRIFHQAMRSLCFVLQPMIGPVLTVTRDKRSTRLAQECAPSLLRCSRNPSHMTVCVSCISAGDVFLLQ